MSEYFEYTPKGVCSRKFSFEIEDGVIQNLTVEGGCNGNLKGISALIKGRELDEVIADLDGILCGDKGTSCPDQIANALKEYKLNK